MQGAKILVAGDRALVVEFGNEIDAEVNRRVHVLGRSLMQEVPEVKEVVPTYRSLLVYFDPLVISRSRLSARIEELIGSGDGGAASAGARVVEIPVCYGGDFGPDIGFVAEHNGLSQEEVIAVHTSRPYLVYMLGFTPGFPYLGGMSERIATPRLKTPRTIIPAGSVGIAGSQTGFYPVASPGGWQLIGRTPIKGFDPQSATPFMIAAGDYLQFRSVSPTEYEAIAAMVAAGRYEPTIGELDAKDGAKDD